MGNVTKERTKDESNTIDFVFSNTATGLLARVSRMHTVMHRAG